MAFDRPTLPTLVTRSEQDFVSRLALSGAILRRSVVAVFARVLAGGFHLLYGNLDFLSKQIFPDTSEVEFLRRQGSLYGINPKAATFATGNATFTGTNGTIVPLGSLVQRSDGVQYQTRAAVTITLGVAVAILDALAAGDVGNASVGVVVTLVSPITSVNSSATVAAGGLTLGSDAENDDDYRVRVIDRLRNPPQGGSKTDYENWARAVPGVTRAWAFPGELGAGTVVVRFVRDDDSPIIPDAGEVAAVQAYLDAARPVTALLTVVAPVAVALNFTIHLVPDTADTRAAVTAELQDLLAADNIVPGTTILLTQLTTAIAIADGVTDYVMTVPAANVVYATGQIPTFGVITWV